MAVIDRTVDGEPLRDALKAQPIPPVLGLLPAPRKFLASGLQASGQLRRPHEDKAAATALWCSARPNPPRRSMPGTRVACAKPRLGACASIPACPTRSGRGSGSGS